VKISVKVDYACRVITEIARLHGTGELARIDHLARVEAIPANFLAQILSELRQGGLITSRRGVQGGYALARPPDQISLCDIVTVIEGDVLELSGNDAGRTGRRLRAVWQEIRTDLAESMKRYTVDRLLAQNVGEMYYI